MWGDDDIPGAGGPPGTRNSVFFVTSLRAKALCTGKLKVRHCGVMLTPNTHNTPKSPRQTVAMPAAAAAAAATTTKDTAAQLPENTSSNNSTHAAATAIHKGSWHQRFCVLLADFIIVYPNAKTSKLKAAAAKKTQQQQQQQQQNGITGAAAAAPHEELYGDPLAEIRISHIAEVREHPDPNTGQTSRFSLELRHAVGTETYDFAAQSAAECARWLMGLRALSAYLKFGAVDNALCGVLKYRKGLSSSQKGGWTDRFCVLDLVHYPTPKLIFCRSIGSSDDTEMRREATGIISMHDVAKVVAATGGTGIGVAATSAAAGGAAAGAADKSGNQGFRFNIQMVRDHEEGCSLLAASAQMREQWVTRLEQARIKAHSALGARAKELEPMDAGDVEREMKRAEEDHGHFDGDFLEEKLLMRGHLKKRSRSNRHLWQKRFFVLNATTRELQYFKSKYDSERGAHKLKGRAAYVAGTIHLRQVSKVEIISEGHKGAKKDVRFDITVPGRVYALMAEDAESCRQWVGLITPYIQESAMAHRVTLVERVSSSHANSAMARPGSGGSSAAAGDVAAVSRQSTQQIAEKRYSGNLAGWLSRKKGSAWIRRYVVLSRPGIGSDGLNGAAGGGEASNAKLLSFKTDPTENEKGLMAAKPNAKETIVLDKVLSVRVATHGKHSAAGIRFDMISPGTVYSLMADSHEECLKWVTALERFMDVDSVPLNPAYFPDEVCKTPEGAPPDLSNLTPDHEVTRLMEQLSFAVSVNLSPMALSDRKAMVDSGDTQLEAGMDLEIAGLGTTAYPSVMSPFVALFILDGDGNNKSQHKWREVSRTEILTGGAAGRDQVKKNLSFNVLLTLKLPLGDDLCHAASNGTLTVRSEKSKSAKKVVLPAGDRSPRLVPSGVADVAQRNRKLSMNVNEYIFDGQLARQVTLDDDMNDDDDAETPEATEKEVCGNIHDDARRATWHCRDCDLYLCDECATTLHVSGETKKHRRHALEMDALGGGKHTKRKQSEAATVAEGGALDGAAAEVSGSPLLSRAAKQATSEAMQLQNVLNAVSKSRKSDWESVKLRLSLYDARTSDWRDKLTNHHHISASKCSLADLVAAHLDVASVDRHVGHVDGKGKESTRKRDVPSTKEASDSPGDRSDAHSALVDLGMAGPAAGVGKKKRYVLSPRDGRVLDMAVMPPRKGRMKAKLRVAFVQSQVVEVVLMPNAHNGGRRPDTIGTVSHKAYSFYGRPKNTRSRVLMVNERIRQSEYTLSTPQTLLESLLRRKIALRNRCYAHAIQSRNRLQQMKTAQHPVHILSLAKSGLLVHPYISELQLFEVLETRVTLYNEAIAHLQKCLHLYRAMRVAPVYNFLRFKASTYKKDKMLEYIATNLQLHTMKISAPVLRDTVDDDGTPTGKGQDSRSLLDGESPGVNGLVKACVVGLFDTTTVGAFASHVQGFKGGGLEYLVRAVEKLRLDIADIEREDFKNKDFEEQKRVVLALEETDDKMSKMQAVQRLEFAIAHRKESVMLQALSALVCCFSTIVRRCVGVHPMDPLRTAIGEAVMERIAAIGVLVEVESLLSTFSKEQGMIADMAFAVGEMSRVKFVFRKRNAVIDKKSKKKKGSATSMSAILDDEVNNDINWNNDEPGYIGISLRDPDVELAIDDYLPETERDTIIPGEGDEAVSAVGDDGEPTAETSRVHFSLGASRLEMDDIRRKFTSIGSPPGAPAPNPLYEAASIDEDMDPRDSDAPRSGRSPPKSPAITAVPMLNRTDAQSARAPPPIVIEMTLSASMYDRLPAILKVDGQKKGKKSAKSKVEPWVYVVPILITQGVNEMQSIANAMGNADYQREVNIKGLKLLNQYARKFISYTTDMNISIGGSKKSASRKANADSLARSKRGVWGAGHMFGHIVPLVGATEKEDKEKQLKYTTARLNGISSSLNEMDRMLRDPTSQKKKNVRLLTLAAEVCRSMSGGRIVCCKSAKDRTSMSVTWEHVGLLHRLYGVGETWDDLQPMLDVMRTEGVRRNNVLRNTGKTAYAFNQLQRQMLPEVFCPPSAACSNNVVN